MAAILLYKTNPHKFEQIDEREEKGKSTWQDIH